MSEVATKPRRGKQHPAKSEPAVSPSVNEAPPRAPQNAAVTQSTPSAALLALRQRLLDTAHQPIYSTRRQQLQTALTELDSLVRKLKKSDETQQAALSVLYELLLVVAERFALLVHGVTQLSAMDRASSLQAIRDERKGYRQHFDQHQAQCQSMTIDAPAILHLLAELSRESL